MKENADNFDTSILPKFTKSSKILMLDKLPNMEFLIEIGTKRLQPKTVKASKFHRNQRNGNCQNSEKRDLYSRLMEMTI